METFQPKVSIVVPVYNGEKVLKRCVDSVIAQNYSDWELLLLNDGSRDNSLTICRSYEKKYPQIRVIDKENEGVSATRNRGIAEAKGTYIQFVDCDDYVSSDFLEVMVEAIEQEEADWVVAGYTRHKGQETKENLPGAGLLEGREKIAARFFELYNRWFLNTPWNKLYRRDKICQNFPVELSLGEDLLFNLAYLQECEKISVLDHAGYQYCIENENSLAIQYREDKFENSLFLHNKVIAFAKEQLGMTKPEDWQDEAFVKGVRFAMTNLMRAKNVSNQEKKQKIRQWGENPEVVVSYVRCQKMGRQDRLIGFLVQHHCVSLLYLLLKIAV